MALTRNKKKKSTSDLATKLKNAWSDNDSLRPNLVYVGDHPDFYDGYLVSMVTPDTLLQNLDKFTIERWWNNVVVKPALTGMIPNRANERGGTLSAQEQAYIAAFAQRGLSRKSGEKFLDSVYKPLKNVTFPGSKFVQNGPYWIALNQPARLTLGIRMRHCLGRVTGSEPEEKGVAVLLPDGCIAYMVGNSHDSSIPDAEQGIQFREWSGPRNEPCREYSSEVIDHVEVLFYMYISDVSNEFFSLPDFWEYILRIEADLRIIDYFNSLTRKGISNVAYEKSSNGSYWIDITLPIPVSLTTAVKSFQLTSYGSGPDDVEYRMGLTGGTIFTFPVQAHKLNYKIILDDDYEGSVSVFWFTRTSKPELVEPSGAINTLPNTVNLNTKSTEALQFLHRLAQLAQYIANYFEQQFDFDQLTLPKDSRTHARHALRSRYNPHRFRL